MFDHLGIHVADLARSRAFYLAALEPLGLSLLQDNAAGDGGWLVFGRAPGAPFFVVACNAERSPDRIHVAFAAGSREAVDRFHAVGLAAGGSDHGAPGPRPSLGGSYYAAYLLDPDGNNVEAGLRS